MRLLARIGMARDVLDDAELLLEAVLKLAPDYRAARHDYALVLVERHKYQQARERARDASAARAATTGSTGRSTPPPASASASTKRRSPLYRELLVGRAAGRRICTCRSRMRSRPSAGATEAIEAYRAAAAARPNYGDAYWSLANLKTYRFTDDEIARMRAEEAAPEHAARRSLSPVLRARQGATRIAASMRSPGATTSAATPSSAPKAAIGPRSSRTTRASRSKSARASSLRARAGIGRREPGSDFHRRTAPRRIDAARADPRLAFAGRGHAGAVPISSASCSSCRAAIPISTIRATRACSRT